ncbi:hypothetical protein ACF0H5_020625 [Mactra antiquata]
MMMVSIFANLYIKGHISDGEINSDNDMSDSEIKLSENEPKLPECQKSVCMICFGKMPWFNPPTQKDGIVLDKSQIEVLENSYRFSQPNFLSAFCEENFDLFPVDSDSEKFLEVPSLNRSLSVVY